MHFNICFRNSKFKSVSRNFKKFLLFVCVCDTLCTCIVTIEPYNNYLLIEYNSTFLILKTLKIWGLQICARYLPNYLKTGKTRDLSININPLKAIHDIQNQSQLGFSQYAFFTVTGILFTQTICSGIEGCLSNTTEFCVDLNHFSQN